MVWSFLFMILSFFTDLIGLDGWMDFPFSFIHSVGWMLFHFHSWDGYIFHIHIHGMDASSFSFIHSWDGYIFHIRIRRMDGFFHFIHSWDGWFCHFH
jgi:hypothetical protein